MTRMVRRTFSLKPRDVSGRVRQEHRSELLAARICDSILKRLNRIRPDHAGSELVKTASSTTTIQQPAGAPEETPAHAFPGRIQEENRQWLLHHLREILEIAMQRVTNPKTQTSDRIKWSRIVIAAGQACNAVLRDIEIDTLKQQINELKALTQARLNGDKETTEDEDPRNQTGPQETQTND